MKLPTTLGKYHLLERMAADEVAEVFRVKTIGIAGFEKLQVLKRIQSTYADDLKFHRAFVDQAKIAFSLNHRNIVQVFEFGKLDGNLFLAMEHIPGVNLHEIARQAQRQRRFLPLGLACYLMGEVAAGLEYAHRKTDHFGKQLDIIHCDIRPRNIACSFEGSVKILDFGFSKTVWDQLAHATRANWQPLYLSPEQVRQEPLDARSDLFSIGTILWELLTGSPLFHADSPDEVRNNILNKPIPNPRSIHPELPVHLDDLVMSCLVRDRTQRIESASDLQQDLHRIQRMLGAVIGSRALSTFISDLLPGCSETRDVRQEGATGLLPPREETAGPSPSDRLVDAATELAEPHNPPADPVLEVAEDFAHPLPPLPIDLQEDDLDETEQIDLDGPRASTRQAELAGVLRSGRHPDADDYDEWNEELSISDVLELVPEEEKTAGSIELIETELPAEAFRTTKSALWPPPAPTQTLGEKKRYFDVTAILDGPKDVLQDTITLIADIAFKLDGILHERTADKLVVLFGLPTADENDIVTAVRFSLDAREAIGHWETRVQGANPVSIRIGIRAGKAKMGDLPSREGYQLVGNTVRDTEILARNSQSGQVAIAGLAARLASRHYVLRESQSVQRPGKSARYYRVLSPRPRSRHRKSRLDMPLIGREMESTAMKTAWRESVLNSVQRSILISGEPGIGKSRLVDEFLHRHTTDARVLSATATPHHRGMPYSVFADLLRALTGIWNISGKLSRSKMHEALRKLLGDAEDQHIVALESIVLPSAERVSDGGRFSRLGIRRAMRGLLNRLATSRPVVVVIEDLHWADSSSMRCLTSLVEHPDDSQGPLFFLMTVRPEEGLVPRNLFEGSTTHVLPLEELDEADRRSLIRQEIGSRAPDAVIQEVERRAGGNPFYIRELSHAFQEMGASGPSEVPPTVEGVITGRVDRLPSEVKSLLQHAAVIGPTFRETILAKLIGNNPAQGLAVLRNRGIIVPGLRTTTPSQSSGKSEHFEREWLFRHVLIQEVVYEAISSVARRDLHRQVGDIMVKRASHGEFGDPPAEVARHLAFGGKAEEAGEYFLRAANEAAAAFAGQEALDLYARALQLSQGDADRQYAIHSGRERVYAQLGRHNRQAADLQAMRQLAGDDPARQADLRNREALRLLRLGEFYQALAAAEQAEIAASEGNDDIAQGEALLRRGEAYERLNDHSRAVESVTRALGIFEEQEDLPNQIRARIGLGRIHLVQAQYDQAFKQYDPALELIKETGDRWQERVLRNNLAVVHYCRGDFAKALGEGFYSLKLCEQFGDRAREGDNASVIGIVYLELGMVEVARRYLDAALTIHQETGSQWGEADTWVYMGLLEASSLRYQEALRCLEQAKCIAERIGAKYITINAQNTVALILCERGAENDAAKAVDEATVAAESAQAARLIVGEIPALSRAARATAMLGSCDAARALSRRAVELLEGQRVIETPEEEIYYTHFRILAALDESSATQHLEQAFAGYQSKLNRLDTEEWQTSFSTQVRLNAAIHRDATRLGLCTISDR